MRVTIRSRKTVGQLLEEALQTYGSIDSLRAHVGKHPKDFAAKVALHDLVEYESEDPAKVVDDVQEVIIPDSAIDQLTIQRLQLLLTLRGLAEATPSARALARTVHRDIKNVSEDIRILSELGLLHVEPGGRGKASKISLRGDQIDLHLVGAEA